MSDNGPYVPLSEAESDRAKRACPWPGTDARRRAAAAIARERERRENHRRELSVDLFGHTGASIPSVTPISDEDLVNLVLWGLRGDA